MDTEYSFEDEVKALEDILNQPSGVCLELFGLNVFRLEDNETWTVIWYESDECFPKVEIEFDNAHDAAKTFVELRHENKIGLDLEIDEQE